MTERKERKGKGQGGETEMQDEERREKWLEQGKKEVGKGEKEERQGGEKMEGEGRRE